MIPGTYTYAGLLFPVMMKVLHRSQHLGVQGECVWSGWLGKGKWEWPWGSSDHLKALREKTWVLWGRQNSASSCPSDKLQHHPFPGSPACRLTLQISDPSASLGPWAESLKHIFLSVYNTHILWALSLSRQSQAITETRMSELQTSKAKRHLSALSQKQCYNPMHASDRGHCTPTTGGQADRGGKRTEKHALKPQHRDSPGSPEVRTLPFQRRGHRFNPWLGN